MDDGSRDRTAEVARRFASKEVAVVSHTRTKVLRPPATMPCDSAKGTTSSGWTRMIFWRRTRSSGNLRRWRKVTAGESFFPRRGPPSTIGPGRARFVHTSLCQDLSPVEWLLRKMGENLHMQTATWLTSRELAEAAGPWDTRLLLR